MIVDSETKSVSLKQLVDEDYWVPFSHKLSKSMVKLIIYRYKTTQQRVNAVKNKSLKKYATKAQMWQQRLIDLGGQDCKNDGSNKKCEPLFGAREVFETFKENDPEYFSLVSSIQDLETFMRDIEDTIGLQYFDDADELLDSYMSASKRDSRRKQPPPLKGPLKKVRQYVITKLNTFKKNVRRAYSCLIGRDDILDELGGIVLSFANNWTTAKKSYLNFIIMGNAGAGKTFIAEHISNIISSSGILFSNTFSEKTSSDFVASYLGQTAPKTNSVLASATGGTLFLDEAYSLVNCTQTKARYDEDDELNGKYCAKFSEYGEEALTAIVAYLSKYRGELMFIAAGYEEDMIKTFIAANEGVNRRFPYQIVLKPLSWKNLIKVMYKKLQSYDIYRPDYSGSRAVKIISERAEESIVNLIKNDPPLLVKKIGRSNPKYIYARQVFVNGSGDMENIAARIARYMNSRITRSGTEIQVLSKCAMDKILDELVYSRTGKHIQTDNNCLTSNNTDELTKGDRVKITSGTHLGKVGTVKRVSPNSVSVMLKNGQRTNKSKNEIVKNVL